MKHLKEVLPDMPEDLREKHLGRLAYYAAKLYPLRHEEWCVLEAILTGRETPDFITDEIKRLNKERNSEAN